MGIIERNLKRLDSTRPFIPTSSDAGNIHTYPDMDPARSGNVYQHTPFLAESGMHSIIDGSSLKEIINVKEFEDVGRKYEKNFATTHPEILSHFVYYNPSHVPRMLSRAFHITDVPAHRSLSLAVIISSAEIKANEIIDFR